MDLTKIGTAVIVILVLGASYFLFFSGGGGGEQKFVVWESFTDPESQAFKEHIEGWENQLGHEIKVVHNASLQQMQQKIGVAAPEGTPDVWIGPNDWLGDFRGQLLTSVGGVLTEEEKNRLYKSALNAVTLDDKVWGVPLASEALLLFYNKEYVSDPPENWSQIREMSDGLDKSKIFDFAFTDPYYNYPLMAAYGGYIFGDNLTDLGLMKGAGAIEVIQEMQVDGYLPIASKRSAYMARDAFRKGNAYMTIDGPWAFRTYTKADVNYGVTDIPTMPNGKDPKPFVGVQSVMVNKYSENLTLARRLAELVTSKETQKSLYEAGGRLPARKDAARELENTEKLQALEESVKKGTPMPSRAAMGAVWSPWQKSLQALYSQPEKLNPETELKSAQNVIMEEIKKNYL